MKELKRDNVRLAFEENGTGEFSFIFIHGSGGDHTHLKPQFDHFSKYARCVNVDLRGHGKSDQPKQEYTIEGFADDIHWLCQTLKIEKPILAGFSMGGNICVDLASRYPNFAKALIILDSGFLYTASVKKMLDHYLKELQTNFNSCIHQIVENGLLPTDRCKEYVENSLLSTPQWIWVSMFKNMIAWDEHVAEKLEKCTLPILYIEAANQLVNQVRLKELCPQLINGKVVGSGHSLTLEVPNQVNAMIDKYVRIV
jgi:pimeloyl-ACP methyl ester carboxylesterase